MISVYAVGDPIRTDPMATVYAVEIYEEESTMNEIDGCCPSAFTSGPACEFSIHDTISREFDPTYVKYLKMFDPFTIRDHARYKFQGTSSREHYIKAFRRISNLYTADNTVPEPISENPHVDLRRKASKNTLTKAQIKALARAEKKRKEENKE